MFDGQGQCIGRLRRLLFQRREGPGTGIADDGTKR